MTSQSRASASAVDVPHRNNVHVMGNPAGRPLLFGYGFGCSQEMWRFVAPALTEKFRVILFDHVGSGGGPTSASTTTENMTPCTTTRMIFSIS